MFRRRGWNGYLTRRCHRRLVAASNLACDRLQVRWDVCVLYRLSLASLKTRALMKLLFSFDSGFVHLLLKKLKLEWSKLCSEYTGFSCQIRHAASLRNDGFVASLVRSEFLFALGVNRRDFFGALVVNRRNLLCALDVSLRVLMCALEFSRRVVFRALDVSLRVFILSAPGVVTLRDLWCDLGATLTEIFVGWSTC